MFQPHFLLKAQPLPRYRNFIWLAVFWGAVIGSLLTVYIYFFEIDWKNPAMDIRAEFIRLIDGVDWEFWAMAVGFTLVLIVLHYLTLRMIPSEHRTSLRGMETIVLIGLFGLSIGGSIFAYQHLQLKNQWRLNLVYYELDGQLMEKASSGQYREAVQLMEKSLQDYRYAVSKLGEEARQRSRGVSGISYIYTTTYESWGHTARHMPYGLASFLQKPEDSRYSSSGHKAPMWQDLARAMSLSGEPIVRCYGFWLLEDKESFREHAYAASDRGDSSCYALAIHAALTDTDPIRAFNVTSKFWLQIDHDNNWSSHRSTYIIGSRMLARGGSLGAYEQDFRNALLGYQREVMSHPSGLVPLELIDSLNEFGYKKEGLELERKRAVSTP